MVVVNLPAGGLMLVPLVAAIWFEESSAIPRNSISTAIVMMATSLVFGWTWWSFAIVRWRIWAYERVDDLDELKRCAVRAKLIWPEGHLLERTEFRFGKLGQRLAELEARRSRTEGHDV